MIAQQTLEFRTRGRGTTDITAEVARAASARASQPITYAGTIAW